MNWFLIWRLFKSVIYSFLHFCDMIPKEFISFPFLGCDVFFFKCWYMVSFSRDLLGVLDFPGLVSSLTMSSHFSFNQFCQTRLCCVFPVLWLLQFRLKFLVFLFSKFYVNLLDFGLVLCSLLLGIKYILIWER